jgi:hypothetical protein
VKPTYPAASAPTSIWPVAPMLNRPARNAIVTPSPAQISGADRSSVRWSDEPDPTAPRTSAL